MSEQQWRVIADAPECSFDFDALILTDKGEMGVGKYHKWRDQWTINGVRQDFDYGAAQFKLTHWMPLPALPGAAPLQQEADKDGERYRWLTSDGSNNTGVMDVIDTWGNNKTISDAVIDAYMAGNVEAALNLIREATAV